MTASGYRLPLLGVRQIIDNFFNELLNGAETHNLFTFLKKLKHFIVALMKHEAAAGRDLICPSGCEIGHRLGYSHNAKINLRRANSGGKAVGVDGRAGDVWAHKVTSTELEPLVAVNAEIGLWHGVEKFVKYSFFSGRPRCHVKDVTSKVVSVAGG